MNCERFVPRDHNSMKRWRQALDTMSYLFVHGKTKLEQLPNLV